MTTTFLATVSWLETLVFDDPPAFSALLRGLKNKRVEVIVRRVQRKKPAMKRRKTYGS